LTAHNNNFKIQKNFWKNFK